MENQMSEEFNVLDEQKEGSNNPKHVFHKVGFALTIMVIIVQIIQTALVTIMNLVKPELMQEAWAPWVLIIIGFYLTAFPVYRLLMKKVPDSSKGEPTSLTISNMVVLFFICMATTYLFNFLTLGINALIGLLKGSSVGNPLGDAVASSNMLYTFICVGILAPIVEEITFRGIMINKISRYGDKVAIWISALAFGLFHLNLSQFFYATALGVIFGYVTVKTKRIRYSIILHMLINIIGSVVMPTLALSTNPALVMVAGLLVIFMIIVGVIFFFKEKKHIVLENGTDIIEPSTRKKTIYGNGGMLAYIILCIGFIIITTFYY